MGVEKRRNFGKRYSIFNLEQLQQSIIHILKNWRLK